MCIGLQYYLSIRFIIIINMIFTNYEKTNKYCEINKIIKQNENITAYLTSRQFSGPFNYVKIRTLIPLFLIMLLSTCSMITALLSSVYIM